MAEKQFDSVSWISQDKKSATLCLGLTAMKCKKKIKLTGSSYEPINTELPGPTRDDSQLTVSAIVQNDSGNPDTYQWVKRHQGKISSAQVKVDPKNSDQLKVTLVKAKDEAWATPFQEHLLQL